MECVRVGDKSRSQSQLRDQATWALGSCLSCPGPSLLTVKLRTTGTVPPTGPKMHKLSRLSRGDFSYNHERELAEE